MILVFEQDHPATEKPTAHHEPDYLLSIRFVIRREQGSMRSVRQRLATDPRLLLRALFL